MEIRIDRNVRDMSFVTDEHHPGITDDLAVDPSHDVGPGPLLGNLG
jgi:hypothetical protein